MKELSHEQIILLTDLVQFLIYFLLFLVGFIAGTIYPDVSNLIKKFKKNSEKEFVTITRVDKFGKINSFQTTKEEAEEIIKKYEKGESEHASSEREDFR